MNLLKNLENQHICNIYIYDKNGKKDRHTTFYHMLDYETALEDALLSIKNDNDCKEVEILKITTFLDESKPFEKIIFKINKRRSEKCLKNTFQKFVL